MTFPGLLIFLPPKPLLELDWGVVGQILLGESQSHINPHVRAKFGCGRSDGRVDKGEGYRQTVRDRQRDAASLYYRCDMASTPCFFFK